MTRRSGRNARPAPDEPGPLTRRAPRSIVIAIALLAAVAGCGADREPDPAPSAPAPSAAQRTAVQRADAIVAAVSRWASASTLAGAQAAAARARGLITGTGVSAFPAAGAARVSVGLLPSDDGAPGLASDLDGRCVQRDVLGGSWAAPRARWSRLSARIAAWRPDNNTFPELPSHAQRVVGWATLTLRSRSLEDAIGYAGHATGHARVVRDAVGDPDGCPA